MEASRRWKSRLWTARLVSFVDDLRNDLRYGIRQIARSPGFTFIILFTLAVGIGANVVIFTVLRGVVLRSLPWPEAHNVVAIWETPPHERWHQPFTSPDYFDIREQNTTFEDVGVYSLGWLNVGGEGEAARIRAGLTTASLLRVLGVQPAIGRLFLDEEEREGSHRVAILSDGVWKRLFGAEPSLIGRDITINGESYQVVGIMPEHYEFPRPWSIDGDSAEIWIPLPLSRESEPGVHWLPAVGRLKDGVTIEQAEADLGTIAARLAEQRPDTNAQTLVWIEANTFRNLPDVRRTLHLLLGTVGLVLLIACANVASMLLARGAARTTDVAVRVSLGAAGRRLMRQLLTESLLLSLAGGIAGVAIAFWGVRAIRGLLPLSIPRMEGIGVDGGVLLFALGVTLLTGLIFGLAPALYAARSDLASALKLGRAGLSAGRSRSRALAGLVVGQLALALVLINTAVLLLVSNLNVLRIPQGFDTDEVLVTRIAVEGPAYEEPNERVAFWSRLLERIRGTPGVQAAGVTTQIPLNGGQNFSLLVEGETYDPEAQRPLVESSYVTPGYLESMGIDLQRGRWPEVSDLLLNQPDDGSSTRRNALVNRAFVERYYTEKDPIGQIIRQNSDSPEWEGVIVGVVENVRQWGLTRPAIPEIYFPFSANPQSDSNLVVRADRSPLQLVPSLREALQDVDSQLTFGTVRTMGHVVEEANQGRRFYTLLITLFAATALVLALVGTYGVMSFYVSRRTHEVGIRMALGARKDRVLGLFVRRGLILAGAGITIGLTATVWGDQLIGHMVYGLSPLHPLVLGGGALFIATVTAAATAVPALRATRANLVQALRTE